ncbi:hypothetical protein ACIQMV_19135 [Streptomyces sp. NPDC091412]|uniref:hypothetical protein n=1 Tax=Streptomyces sp. NPDC091412 TaxID=3366002 RepID=UPI00381759BE
MTAKLLPAHLAQAIAQEAVKHEAAPLREGQVYAVLVAAGYAAKEIAELAGADWNRVDLRLAPLDLVEEGKGALEQELLPVGLASYVARLSEPNQRLMLVRWLRGDFKNARHAERYASAIYEDEQTVLAGL